MYAIYIFSKVQWKFRKIIWVKNFCIYGFKTEKQSPLCITINAKRKCDKANISCISKDMETSGRMKFSCQKNPYVCISGICEQGGLFFAKYRQSIDRTRGYDDTPRITKWVWQIMGLWTTWFWCGQNATFFFRSTRMMVMIGGSQRPKGQNSPNSTILGRNIFDYSESILWKLIIKLL